jgi:hypothetical protein
MARLAEGGPHRVQVVYVMLELQADSRLMPLLLLLLLLLLQAVARTPPW